MPHIPPINGLVALPFCKQTTKMSKSANQPVPVLPLAVSLSPEGENWKKVKK